MPAGGRGGFADGARSAAAVAAKGPDVAYVSFDFVPH